MVRDGGGVIMLLMIVAVVVMMKVVVMKWKRYSDDEHDCGYDKGDEHL